MKLRISLAVMLALVAVLALGSSWSSSATSKRSVTGENAVVYWSGIAETAIPAPSTAGGAARPPASSTVLAGIVHGAMYDAVAAVEGGLEPFATGVSAPPEASADAAVAKAARDVLVARLPALPAATVQTAYDAFVAAIPAGQAKDGGIAVGAAAAAGMLALRTGDHFDDVVPYAQPTPGPGVFEPIGPPSPAIPGTPVDVKLGKVRPFTYTTPDYRPDAPYKLTSKQYARDVAELQELGGNTSTVRTPAQTETARFFTDHAFKQYSRGLRGVAIDRALDLRESARLLAYTWVAVADTMIACWEAKYHYYLWRPTHAIKRADTDGNPATTADAAWEPLFVGNHPEYPSGHGCITAAVATSLERYLGTKEIELTLTSTVAGSGPPRTYRHVKDLVADVENARVWGGLHYRTTMTETAKHFPRVARDVGKHSFLEGAKHDKGGKK